MGQVEPRRDNVKGHPGSPWMSVAAMRCAIPGVPAACFLVPRRGQGMSMQLAA